MFCVFLAQGVEGYARKDSDAELTEEDNSRLRLSAYDKNDLGQFQEKMVIIFGCYFGFRGKHEHWQLKTIHFESGTFPSTHPVFPGLKYTGLRYMPNDKRFKLGLGTPYI